MIKLVLVDEVNAFFDGLSSRQIDYIIDKTKIFDQAARQTAAYKLGHDDGYRSFFGRDGLFFQYMIPKVLDLLEGIGVNLDDIELVDEREANGIDFSSVNHVDDFFLMEEIGFPLRSHQKEAINAVITEMKGIIDHSTSSGKSATTLGISKAFDGVLKTMVIVPSEQLSKQTFEYYEKSELNAIRLHAGIKGKKREEAFEKYDHIIITNKLLLNCLDYVKDKPFFLMIDEIHSYFGEQFTNALRIELANCPGRIGLTGTVPRDKLKRESIHCHLGGSTISKLQASELISKKQAATLNISMVTTSHPEMKEISKEWTWEWEMERNYITTHKQRLHAIADFIKSLPKKNTLVLCYAHAGKILSHHFDGRMISEETPVETRDEWVSVFDNRDDAIVLGSWGCVATGLSRNRIFRVILVDPSKNSAVQQSIGRGLRLDGEVNHVEVIDIGADTKYAVKHRQERMKIYKSEKFPFEDSGIVINVEDYL